MDSAVGGRQRQMGGVRQRARYREFYHEARRQLQAEEYLERQRTQARTDYCTSYEEGHGRPGFEPALERQLRDGAALEELHPLDGPVLSLWSCLQAGRASWALPNTSSLTAPVHLSVREPAAERRQQQQRLDPLDRLQARGWPATTFSASSAGRAGWGCVRWPEADGPSTLRYPLADVLLCEKHWCDRHEDPVKDLVRDPVKDPVRDPVRNFARYPVSCLAWDPAVGLL